MPSVLKFEVHETVDELKKSYLQERHPRRKERLHMLYIYKSKEATTRNELSKQLARSVSTISTWMAAYRAGGIKALLTFQPTGHRPFSLPSKVEEALKTRLHSSEGFESYHEIMQWLKEEWGLEIPYSTVHSIVCYRLNARLKTVRPVSAKQDLAERVAVKKSIHIHSQPLLHSPTSLVASGCNTKPALG